MESYSGAIVAMVAFAGLFLVGLIAIKFWAGRVRKNHYATTVWKTVISKSWSVAILSGIL